MDKVFTTAYHPQTNGQVKRFNSSLAAGLTVYTDEDQTDWDQYLEALAFAYRTSLVDAIHNSPFFLVHGRDARLPSDVHCGDLNKKSPTTKTTTALFSLQSSAEPSSWLVPLKSKLTFAERNTMTRARSYDVISTAHISFDAASPALRTSLFIWTLRNRPWLMFNGLFAIILRTDDFRLRSSTQALSSDTANLTTAHDKGPTSDGSLTANTSEPVLPRDGAGPHYASSISVEDRRGDQGAEVTFATGAPPCDDTSADFVSDQSCSKNGESAATSDEEDLNATEAEAQVTQHLRPTPTITHTYKSSRPQRRNVGTLPSCFRDGFVASLTY